MIAFHIKPHQTYPWIKDVAKHLPAEFTNKQWPIECDAAVFWSWHHHGLDLEYKKRGIPVFYLENGFLPPRKEKVSVALNGFNNRGIFRTPQGHKPVPELNPWQQKDGPVLIIGAHEWDFDLFGVDMGEWHEEMVMRFENHVFRPHPLAHKNPPKNARLAPASMEDCLNQCSFCVTYASNAAIESVIAGVPTISLERESMAWEVTSHDFDSPIYMPDREEWLQKLAWAEFDSAEEAAEWIESQVLLLKQHQL